MAQKTLFTNEQARDSAGDYRLVVRALVGTLLLLVVSLGMIFSGRIAARIWQTRTFHREVRHLQQTLEPWRSLPPPGIDAHVWREAAGLVTATGVGNVCFSPSHVSLLELRRLQRDVEAEMAQGPVTPQKLDWLWQRLGQTGPRGRKYITQMQPLWDEAKGQVQPVPPTSE